MKKTILFCACLLFVGCGSARKNTQTVQKESRMLQYAVPVKHPLLNEHTFRLTEFSEDESYGYTMENPVKVGGVTMGPLNERRFLNALAGPKGEPVRYERVGSFRHSPNTPILDKYVLTYDGAKEDIFLYINMYEEALLKVPVGFSLRTDFSQ